MQLKCLRCRADYAFPVELLHQPVELRCAACGLAFRLTAHAEVEIDPEVWQRASRAPPPMPAPAPESEPAPQPEPEPLMETAPALARLELVRAKISRPASGTPRAVKAADGDDRTPGLAGYHFAEGGGVGQRRRRRLVVIAHPRGRAAPQARVVALPANFGRSKGAEPIDASAPPPTVASGDAPARARSGGRRAALAALLLAALTAAAIFVWLRPQSEPSAPAPGALTDAPAEPSPRRVPAAEPPFAPSEPPPPAAPRRGPTGELVADFVSAEELPEARAVLVQGYLHNGTDAPVGDLRVEAILQIDGRAVRRREVWCCDTWRPDAARAVAEDPRHAHFRQQLAGTDRTQLEAGAETLFSIIFPRLPDDLLEGEHTATLRVVSSSAQP